MTKKQSNKGAQDLGALREIPYMGVIYVVAEAMKLGFYNGNPDWCNLGQGQPEIGEMEGAPSRYNKIAMQPGDHAYGHITGTKELRETVAAYCNRLYRKGMKSQYTAANVAVAAGGRLALTRVFSALNAGRVGYQVPDYTAYEDMLNYQMPRITPVLVPTEEKHGFGLPGADFAAAVKECKLDAYIFSNPCNPTGKVIRGGDLQAYVDTARKQRCTVIFDEFYSHFHYTTVGKPAKGPVSAAEYVEDVDRDPVLLVDGLTKSFRYPGWRVGWTVGPAAMIEVLGRAASAIDGGPGQPIQRAAVDVLQPDRADQETTAVRNVFTRKRNLMVGWLKEQGIRCSPVTEGTFYAWGCIADLPKPLNTAEAFFREGLKRRVMTVPGEFFDVNPGKLRKGPSPFKQWVRFSFGPPEANVREGLSRLGEMIVEARRQTRRLG